MVGKTWLTVHHRVWRGKRGLLSIMVGKSWWQEPEAAVHRASAIRKQRKMNAVLRSFSPLIKPSSHPIAGFLSSKSIVFKDQLTRSLFAVRLFFSLALHVLFLSCFPASVVQFLLPEHVTGTLSIQGTVWMLKSSFL